MIYCKYCGDPIFPHQKQHRNQVAHTLCIQKQPYDVKIKQGNCCIEFHSELLTKKRLEKLMRGAFSK